MAKQGKAALLLVDDDRAVLEALEAVLEPAFGEICRIEAFEDPREVLQALPGWSQEQRPIGVAVVDQKMPWMSGVELLQSLRNAASSTPDLGRSAGHMRAMLLTGYAGLDSAVAAKNDADVDRYVEKPWHGPGLVKAVAEALATHLQEAGTDRWFSFREVSGVEELRAHLELRYQVYRMTPGIVHLLPTSGACLDVDAYDAFSHFLSLYAHNQRDCRLAGTLRVVRETTTPTLTVLEAILRELPDLDARLHAPRSERLPLMTYLVDRAGVATLLERIDELGEKAGEPGRLTLDPRFRSSAGGSTGSVALARFLIESATAFFFSFLFFFEHAILTCIPAHVRLYRPLGFHPTAGTRTRFQSTLQVEVACLHGMTEKLPSPVRERVLSMAKRIKRIGLTCSCATFPACLPGPYETGDFRNADLFCPLLADEKLRAGSSFEPSPGEILGTPPNPATTPREHPSG